MSRRVSRRTFIGGAGAATALVAGGVTWAALLNRDDDPSLPSSPLATPTPQPTSTPLPPPPPGGRQVISAPGALDIDTFDTQLASKSPAVEILGRTHSRLLNWDGVAKLQSDLAGRWEEPDAETVLFHLNPNAKWHDRQPLNGRPVTAADVVAHFQRALEIAAGGKAPLAQRYHDYASVASVDSPGEGQVRFRLNRPDPFFLGTLAGEFALVQAPEAVASFGQTWSKLDSDHVIGSGPWTFDWTDGGAKFTAFPQGHRKPSLEELVILEPRNVAQRFIEGTLDEALIRDRRHSALVRASALDARVFKRWEREVVMSSFFIGAPPWSDTRLVNAISGALLRPELAANLFGKLAEPAYPVPPALVAPDEVRAAIGHPGYVADPNWQQAARQRWIAMGGPGLGTITIDFPSIFDPLYSASSIVIDMLNEALGNQFRPAVETYTTISKRVLEGYYGNGRAAFWFGWGPPLPSPSRERYLAETYAAGSPGLRVTGATPFHLAGDASNVIGAGFQGIVPWVQQFAEVYRRPLTAGPEPSPFWSQHRDIERTNPR